MWYRTVLLESWDYSRYVFTNHFDLRHPFVQFQTGDRILEVSGVDLRHESHEKAVEAIRNAANPVTFVIQSLIPWVSLMECGRHLCDVLCSFRTVRMKLNLSKAMRIIAHHLIHLLSVTSPQQILNFLK
jgi:hypothetical protein